jgi:hypothetical protein
VSAMTSSVISLCTGTEDYAAAQAWESTSA